MWLSYGVGQKDQRKVSLWDATFFLESVDDILNLLHVLYTIPKQRSTGTGETSVSTFEVPAAVFIISTGKPEQFAVVFFDRVENIVHHAVYDTATGGEEMGHDGNFALWS